MVGYRWWGSEQWAAYLEHKDLPVKAVTKQTFEALSGRLGEQLSAKDLAELLLTDALLALRLLRAANQRLTRHLRRDITTPLGVVLGLGSGQFAAELAAAPVVPTDNHGFDQCEGRAALAAQVAVLFGSQHFDLDPGELALAALLANAGEIELWAFAPELPQAALNELAAGRARRSETAQRQSCGFAFKEVTLLLIEHWQLPPLLRQLIRGDETLRARLARLAVNTARHLGNSPDDPALPADVAEAAKLTGAQVTDIAAGLPLLDGQQRARIAEAAASRLSGF